MPVGQHKQSRPASPRLPSDNDLDALFQALSHRTRRAIVARLVKGPASITDVAAPFAMTLPAVCKHLRVLQSAKVISIKAEGGSRQCSLSGEPFKDAAAWIEAHRVLWAGALERLARYAEPKDRS